MLGGSWIIHILIYGTSRLQNSDIKRRPYPHANSTSAAFIFTWICSTSNANNLIRKYTILQPSLPTLIWGCLDEREGEHNRSLAWEQRGTVFSNVLLCLHLYFPNRKRNTSKYSYFGRSEFGSCGFYSFVIRTLPQNPHNTECSVKE